MTDTKKQLSESEAELLQLIYSLMALPHPPTPDEIDKCIFDDENFQKVYNYILAVRLLSSNLRLGELHTIVKGKGYILGNLKAMSADLQHLIWQTQQIAKGDFTQKVDFLGDFSTYFNKMTQNLERMSTALRKIAITDGLTKLYNRGKLNSYLKKLFVKVKKEKRSFSLLMIDIDHFKHVNDEYGHHAGDLVLVELARILKDETQGSGMVARYGGEEFMCVLPDRIVVEAMQIAENILRTVRKTVIPIDKNRTISITVSIGVSILSADDIKVGQPMKRSDTALYAAKNSGRDRICFDGSSIK